DAGVKEPQTDRSSGHDLICGLIDHAEPIGSQTSDDRETLVYSLGNGQIDFIRAGDQLSSVGPAKFQTFREFCVAFRANKHNLLMGRRTRTRLIFGTLPNLKSISHRPIQFSQYT